MKRPLKITLVVLGSLLGLVLLVLAVVSCILFSGRNLASVVRGQLNRQDVVEFRLDKADLVFFRTFPEISLHISNFGIRDLASGEDIAHAQDVYAALDLRAFLFDDELKVRKVALDDIYADVSCVMSALEAMDGRTDVPEDADANMEKGDTTGFALPFGLIDVSEVSLNDVHVVYAVDGGLAAELEGLSLEAGLGYKEQNITGRIGLDVRKLTCAVADTVYCSDIPVSADLDFTADMAMMEADIRRADLKVDSFPLSLTGKVGKAARNGIAADLDMKIADWNLKRLLELVPEAWAGLLEGISADGSVNMDLKATGTLADSIMPVVSGKLLLADASFEAPFMPVRVDKADMDVDFSADVNKGGSTHARLNAVSAVSGRNRLDLSGDVDDLLGNLSFDLSAGVNADLSEILPILPDSMGVSGSGNMSVNLDACGNMEMITGQQFDKIKASGTVRLDDIDVVYQDTVCLKAGKMNLGLELNKAVADRYSNRNRVDLMITEADFSMGKSLSGRLSGAGFDVSLKALPLGDVPLEAYCDFAMDSLSVRSDSLVAAVSAPGGKVAMLPSLRKGGQGRILLDYSNESVQASMGKDMSLKTKMLSLSASVDRDSIAEGVLEQWLPELKLSLHDGDVNTGLFGDPVRIPSVELAFSGDTLDLKHGSFAMGNSDFELSGVVANIRNAMADKGLFEADFDFTSQFTDVDQLLSYFSGMGTEEEETEAADAAQEAESQDVAESGDPFMVPEGVNLTLNTKISKAIAMGNTIENVGGKVTVNDGVAILRQLGFTSDAAKMQLTAMYKSPRKNHLFVGLDFHLLDIEIDKLIKMVPKVDSLVPMLKSFAGQAEFHLALETNLNSKYELKKSTILGAAAIEGKNLVVLDSETFDTIAKMMMFKKSTENVIDSLVVDMTVFRDEVDIYPFVVSMDNYKVILSGRHNLDMSFNYHLDCVSPIRLGLDVKGSLGNLKFGITPTRYKNLFTPERRNDLQERTMNLMNLINSSLKESVVEQ